MTDDPVDKPEEVEEVGPSVREFLSLRSALGANIRRLRTERGWSQEALAEEMTRAGFDWSRVTVAQSENEAGRSRRVTVEELIGLALVLRRSVLSLLGPGPIAVGDTWQSRDDLIALLVGNPQTYAPDELELLAVRAAIAAQIKRMHQEENRITKQIEQIRREQEDQ